MQFKYNQSGIRTSKTVNGVKTEYTYVGDMLVSQETGNEVINFAYTAGGAPLGFTYNGTPYFYLLNLQGDIISIYDSTGEIVVNYTYDTWGKLISITGSMADTIGVKNPLRYRGYYYDTETSLYYLQSRYYDPETCRFINADAYIIAGNDYIQGTNMYAYCYNNPVMYVDPSGYEPKDSDIAILEDLLWILIYASYIEEYAKENGKDANAIFDFLERTTNKETTLSQVAHNLKVGISVMTGTAWWLDLSSNIGTAKDLISILQQEVPNLFNTKSNLGSIVVSVGVDFVIDYLNPLVSNIELVTYLGKHLFISLGDFGISYMALNIGTGVATTVNPYLGVVVGTVLLFAGSEAWYELTKDI